MGKQEKPVEVNTEGGDAEVEVNQGEPAPSERLPHERAEDEATPIAEDLSTQSGRRAARGMDAKVEGK